MAVNLTLSSNGSFPQPQRSYPGFHASSEMDCLLTKPSMFILGSFNITSICLLTPLSTFILYHCFQRFWISQESSSSLSHSDCFVYHLSAIELLGVCGNMISFYATFSYQYYILAGGLLLHTFTIFAETYFHVLTCVERYLAVVHPVTYLSLRNHRGIRIRNISIGFIWLLCCLGIGLMMIGHLFVIVIVCVLACSLPAVFFCSASVLHALIRSGPGEQGEDKERVHPMKKRAFYTITAKLGVLMLRFLCGAFWAGVSISGNQLVCTLGPTDAWFNLPSSLILPLLFLHRTGKLGRLRNMFQ